MPSAKSQRCPTGWRPILKITKVTDPFGRYATFEYNDVGQLVKITDVIGLASEFEYGASDFIRALKTPYGTTTFRHLTGPYDPLNDRWVEATDPLGGTERVQHLLKAFNPLPASDPANTVPNGFTENSNLNTHLSVYYSKLAMDQATTDPPDPSTGVVARFRSSTTFKVSGSHLQSIKRPLQNRVWFQHVGETVSNGVGPDGRPAMIGRVLDDGTSQIHRYEYNVAGALIRYIDPVGRESGYVFGSGSTSDPDQSGGTGVDLLAVKHKNGAIFETLAQYTYSSQRNLLTQADAFGYTWTYTYNSQGQLLTAKSPPTTSTPAGLAMTLTYNTNGYVTSATGAVSGATTTYTFDAYGRFRTISPPAQDTITLDYDALNRLTRVTFGDGTYKEIVYNRLDAEHVRDRLGRWSHVRFDALRRP
jgi:YD repeat-containing protein